MIGQARKKRRRRGGGEENFIQDIKNLRGMGRDISVRHKNTY